MVLSCYSRLLSERIDSGWNFRDECELLYAASGSVRLIASDGSQVFTLREGEGVFIPLCVISNVIAADGGAEVRSVIFSPDILWPDQESGVYLRAIAPLLSSSPAFVSISPSSASDIGRAYSVLSERPFCFELEARDLISSVMLGILREMSDGSYDKGAGNDRMLRMMLFVKEHYGENIRVADIAAAAYISERECLRSFSRSLGISPLQFLLSYRLREAARLLRQDELNISQIAYSTGFESPSHFSALFRRQYGMTPSEYRKRSLA